jgi:hypothetical protein
MKDKTVETRVIFKKFDGQVSAFLLDLDANPGYVVSYAHIGQHSDASIEFFYDCEPAKESEYSDLKEELESMGYKLLVRKHWIHK